jgi:hypothetical protein
VDKNIYEALDKIKNIINKEYGFEGNIPRINYGPCGVFSYLFNKEWNSRFSEKVHICFVMTKDSEECDHVCICLPTGELYDGGIGVHTRDSYKDFIINDMYTYDHDLLEKWSYGLDRTYPRFCPKFNRKFVEKIIADNFNLLQKTI